jgi:hypothetical protein
MDLDQIDDILLLLAAREQQQKRRVQTGQLGQEYIKDVKRISQLPRDSRLSISIRKLWQDSVDFKCPELSTVLCARS